MDPKQITSVQPIAKAAPALNLTFSPQITRDQLVNNLDKILRELGCTNCGLNGIDSIRLRVDPYPYLLNIQQIAAHLKFENLSKVEVEQVAQH